MDVSVIIPAHDDAATIGDQLDALARQRTSLAVEVLVVDNLSTDDTAKIAAGYTDRLSHLRIVPAHEDRGAAYARNVGAAHAGGRLLLFCDADDVVEDGWIDAMAAGLELHDAVGGSLDERSLTSADSRAIRGLLVADRLPVVMGFLPRAVGASMGVRREVFEAVGGFDSAFERSQDTELSFRLQVAGYGLGFVPEARVRYRHRPDVRQGIAQAYGWARVRPRLYLRYRDHGLPRSWGLRTWGALALRAWWLAAGRARRLAWLGDAARAVGRLHGSIRHRTWYL